MSVLVISRPMYLLSVAYIANRFLGHSSSSNAHGFASQHLVLNPTDSVLAQKSSTCTGCSQSEHSIFSHIAMRTIRPPICGQKRKTILQPLLLELTNHLSTPKKLFESDINDTMGRPLKRFSLKSELDITLLGRYPSLNDLTSNIN